MHNSKTGPVFADTLSQVNVWLENVQQLIADAQRTLKGLTAVDAEQCIAASARAQALTSIYHKRSTAFQALNATDIFFDPAWHMLLDLFIATKANRKISVSSLCIASLAAPTTALRYINAMLDKGLIERSPDPNDSRRVFILLTPPAFQIMTDLLS